MKRLSPIVFFCALCTPLSALATVYDCTFSVSRGEWLPQHVVLEYSAETGDAIVFDEMIKEFVGRAIPATLAAQSAKKISFSWKVRASDKSGNQAMMIMRFAYYKETREARVTSQAAGYTNVDSAKGSCAVK
ncbi:MAG: hypothetical protein ACOH2M_17805 [Cypionkella sp.]|jgi:hypothetical protein